MAVQALIPGVGFVEESQTIQALVPGAGYINETVSAGGSTYNESTAETASAVDTPTAVVTYAATAAESGSAVETPSSAATFPATAAETASAADTSNGSATTVHAATTAETATATDVPSALATFAAASVETGAATDAQVAWISAYARPVSDVDATGWLTSTGSGTLASHIDETTYSDTDYIYTQTADADAEVALTSMTDPGVSYGHIMRYRARAVNGGQIKVSVYEGAALVQEWTDTLTDTFDTIEHMVTNDVTDYNALRLRFTALMGT